MKTRKLNADNVAYMVFDTFVNHNGQLDRRVTVFFKWVTPTLVVTEFGSPVYDHTTVGVTQVVSRELLRALDLIVNTMAIPKAKAK